MFYYGHGSWVALVVFAAFALIRLVSSQRRRGGHPGPPGPRSSFTGGNRPGPPAGPAMRPPAAPDPSASGTAPGWFADPFFKHEQRYWSGTEWTEHVTDRGSPGTDPPPPVPGPRRVF